MKFCWATITVNSMDRSVWFYQDVVGLTVDRRYAAGPGIEICFLGDGDTKVELLAAADRKAPGRAEGISLGFTVPSLDQMMKIVREKGIDIESGPFQPNPHIRFFYVRDPDGISVQFVENL